MHDPYFYITREDMLELLKQENHKMINMALEMGARYLITEDKGYYLVQVKQGQVDLNQMTMLKLLDFISVMLYTKRDDLFDVDSPILFTNNFILEFMKIHHKFLIADEVVRICILSRRFRLAINVLNNYNIAFNIEFFKQALLSNSFDTAFFMLKNYEDDIFSKPLEAIDGLIEAYRVNNKFLKSKLHMAKIMIPVLNFSAAKTFLEIIGNGIGAP